MTPTRWQQIEGLYEAASAGSREIARGVRVSRTNSFVIAPTTA